MEGKSWSRTIQNNKKKDVIEEEECDACEAMGTRENMSQLKEKLKNSSVFKSVGTNNNNSASKSSQVTRDETEDFWEMRDPPDTIELGNCGWTLLHTMAAYYPQRPTEDKKQQVSQFLSAFSKVYPCNYCAKHFSLLN